MKINFLILTFLFLVACGSKKEEPATINLDDELLLLSEQENPTQKFLITPTKDTFIQGAQGTQIFLKANSLRPNDGKSIREPVEIELREFYKVSDMILNNLTTTSNGKLLETSGMIYLNAFSEGEELHLDSKLPAKIRFNKLDDAPYMQTFLGDTNNFGINWRLDTANVFDTIKYTLDVRLESRQGNRIDTVIYYTRLYGVVNNDTFQITSYINTDLDSVAVSNKLYYDLHTTQLKWINCDYFIDADSLINIYISKSKNKFTRDYLVFKDINSIMDTWEHNDSTTVFRNIPFESEVSIISIATDSINYYLATKNKKLEKDQEQIDLKYRTVTKNELKEELKKADFDL